MHHIISHKKITIDQVAEILEQRAQLSLSDEAKSAIIKCRTYLDSTMEDMAPHTE